MKILQSSIIYENPLPQLESKQSFFPYLCECKDGSLLATTAIGQAFESVDSHTYACRSTDGGKTWSAPQPLYNVNGQACPITDYAKPVCLPDGRLVLMGYAYLRESDRLPIGNPETGGQLDDILFYAVSEDNGVSWSDMQPMDCAWGPHVEASAPITLLQDGSWITPITGFPKWDGTHTGPVCGRALRSYDGGKTWNDDAVCMDFGGPIACYEQRMCQLADGTIIDIGWNENLETGERFQNHYTYSTDNGKTFSKPIPTGILGQASSVCAIGGQKLLALHAIRRDTHRPGIYACVVDFSNREWNIVEQKLLWEPPTPVTKDTKMAEIFSFLKFGQPGANLLADGTIMMTHWYAEQGQYKTVATKIEL